MTTPSAIKPLNQRHQEAVQILKSKECERLINELTSSDEHFIDFINSSVQIIGMMRKPMVFSSGLSSLDVDINVKSGLKTLAFMSQEFMNKDQRNAINTLRDALFNEAWSGLSVSIKPTREPYLSTPVATGWRSLHSEEQVYAMLPAKQPVKSFLHRILHQGQKPYPLMKEDLIELERALEAHELGHSNKLLNSIDSIAFSGAVSKQAFARAYIRAIQAPTTVAFYAMVHLSLAHYQSTKDKNSEASRYFAESLFGLERGSFQAFSGAEFKVGQWANNTPTPDELKAIPFLVGSMPEYYKLADQDHSKHAESVKHKLLNAGFKKIAAVIEEKRWILKNEHNRHEAYSSPSL